MATYCFKCGRPQSLWTVPSPNACRAHPYFSANSFLPASRYAHTVFQCEKTWGRWLPIPLPAPLLLPYLPALAACTVPDRAVASMLAQNMAGHCLGRHKTMPETRVTLSCYRGPGPARGGEALCAWGLQPGRMLRVRKISWATC